MTHAQSTLLHYWSFNSLTTAFHNPGIPPIAADFSVIDTSKAKVVYALYPGTSTNYAGFWDNNVGDTTNARNGFAAGNSLRFRNPSDSSEMRVYFPTTNYSNIVIKYALQSSSVASGQSTELFDYSIDSGLTWKTSGLSFTSLDVTQSKFQGANWGLVTVSVAGDTAVNNNPKFVFRIRFISPIFNSGSGNNRFENLSVEGTFVPPVSTVPLSLIHYWNFNNLTTAYHNPGIPPLKADFSTIDTIGAKLVYTLAPGTSPNYAGFIDNNPGDLTNARNGAPTGQSLRFRNPSDSSELRLYMPTNNYKNIVVKYALQSSSVASGQKTELFDYSIDGGATWKTSGLSITSLDVTQPQFQGTNWGFVTVDLSADTTVNNNYYVVFRIRFSGNTTGGSGNNRFENITVEGTYVPPTAAIYTWLSPAAGSVVTVGKHAAVSFSASGPVGAKRRVEYSTDRGLTWNFIAMLSGTSTDWIVPNTPSTNAIIRVVDEKYNFAGTGQVTIFYPGPGSIIVKTPSKGDTLIIGNHVTLSFPVSGVVSETRFIDYSIDSGATWSNIGSVVLGTSYDWVVPNAPSSQALIRVRDTVNVVGISGLFTIVSPAPTKVITALIHYWNFDNVVADTISPKNPTYPVMHPDYSALDVAKAKMSFYLLPGTSLTASLRYIDGVTPGSDTNKRAFGTAGVINQALRLRNPVDSLEVRVSIPTTGYTHIKVKYALESSSTKSGDSTNIYDYSIDGGLTWKNGKSSGMKVNGSNVDTLDTTPALYQGTSWGLIFIDLSADKTVENNPNLIFRIRFKGNTSLLSGNNRFDNFTVEGDIPVSNQYTLVHYWNFDNIVADTSTAAHPGISDLTADYSVLDKSKARITYYLLPGTSFVALRYIDPVAPGADTNRRSIVSPGAINNALRLRNPLDSMQLRCFFPTTGFTSILIKYALESSSTKSGDSTEIFDYSVDGGTTWKNGKANGMLVNGSNADTLDTTPTIFQGTSWGLITIDLSADKTVENNPNFVFRVKFKGNTSLASGNNRFDNFTVEGVGSGVVTPPIPSISVSSPAKADTLVTGTHKTISFSVTGAVSATRTIGYSPNGGITWNSVGVVNGTTTFDWVVPNAPTGTGVIRVKDTSGVIGKSGTFAIVQPGAVLSVSVATKAGKVIPGDSTLISWTASGYLGGTVNIDVSYDSQQTWTAIQTGLAYKSKSYILWGTPKTPHIGAVVRVTFISGAQGLSSPFDIVNTAGVHAISEENAVKVWPNPMNRYVHLGYDLFEASDVILTLFDVTGKKEMEISRGVEVAGPHTIILDGATLTDGTYFYVLNTGGRMAHGKIVVAR
ncbi:MAG: T9SS type A sorting domain-containing protein [Candidatus Kapaibacterium sp.]